MCRQYRAVNPKGLIIISIANHFAEANLLKPGCNHKESDKTSTAKWTITKNYSHGNNQNLAENWPDNLCRNSNNAVSIYGCFEKGYQMKVSSLHDKTVW